MHVDQPRRPGAFVQVIDILRDDQQSARPLRIEPGKRMMRGVGHHGFERCAPPVIEAEHQRPVPYQCVRRADLIDAVALRAPVRIDDIPPAFAAVIAKRRDA